MSSLFFIHSFSYIWQQFHNKDGEQVEAKQEDSEAVRRFESNLMTLEEYICMYKQFQLI